MITWNELLKLAAEGPSPELEQAAKEWGNGGGRGAGSVSPAPSPALDGGYPPVVTRGANCQRVEVGVDQVTMVVPLVHLGEAERRLGDLLGPAERMGKGGRHFYDDGQRYGCASALCWDGPETDRAHAGVLLDLKASGVARMGQLALWELCAWVESVGGRATRFDVRLDFRDQPGLIDLVHGGCQRGELRGLRLYELREPRRSSGEVLGRTLTMGRRGRDGCGRFVRIYDKGLESGEAECGEWERYEVEFSSDAAAEVMAEWVIEGDLFLQDRDGESAELLPHCATWLARRALGAVDFLEPGQRRCRANRLAWWREVLGGIDPVLTVIRREATNLASKVAWVKRQVVPTLEAMARMAGVSISTVLRDLVGRDVRPGRITPAVIEYAVGRGQLGNVDGVLRARDGRGLDTMRSWVRSIREAWLRDLDDLVAMS